MGGEQKGARPGRHGERGEQGENGEEIWVSKRDGSSNWEGGEVVEEG